MTPSWNVKARRWTKLFLLLCAGNAAGALYPKLGCGTYLASGELKKGQHGHYTLAVRAGTTSRLDLILLGGSFDAKFARRGTRTVAKVYLPRATDGLETPFVFLQELLPGRPAPKTNDQVKLVKKEPCGQMGRYRKR